MTALGPTGTEHLLTGGLTAAVAVASAFAFPATRRWWPTIAPVVVVLATVVEGTTRLVPADMALAAGMTAVGAAAAFGARQVTGEGGTVGRCRRTGPALAALAAAGVVGGVPDTEVALRVAGMATVLAVVGLVVRRSDARAWVAPWLAVVWGAAAGATGRPAAFAGTVACLGVVLAAPVALGRARGGAVRLAAIPAVMLLVVQAAGALVAGRGPGLEDEVGAATLGAALVLGAQAAVLALTAALSPRVGRLISGRR